jgi:hypothetical protein
MADGATLTLWRPVGPQELELIRQSGMRGFPPRLPEQPIFYPVLTEAYAVKIARGFIDRYAVQEAGGQSHKEYWIPADDLDAFNQAIIGPIEVVRSFP